MTQKVYILATLGVITAIIVNWYLFGSSNDMTIRDLTSPYYPASWCSPLQPIAVLYMAITNLWFNIIGGNTPKSLPEPNRNNSNKVAIVTGANTGIGYETARTLVVEYGWDVILACRSTQKAVSAMLDINEERDKKRLGSGEAIVLKQPLDLSSFGSLQLFVEELKERYPKVDVLINNAGMNSLGRSGRFDLTFQSNFLGHFFLTREMMEASILLTGKGGGHVINLSSVMHHFVGIRPLDETYWKSMVLYSEERPPETYAASKLAAILFSQELTRRYDLRSTAVNPGAAASDIWRNSPVWIQRIMKIFFLSPHQASRPVVAAAVLEGIYNNNNNATYFQPYWKPRMWWSNDDDHHPLFPVVEMLGPYVGYVATTPRLPVDGGREAALALWKVSEEFTSLPQKRRQQAALP